MKPSSVVAIAVTAFGLFACSRGFRSEQTSGDARAILVADTYPLSIGRNLLRLEVTDRSGDRLPADASVEVRYRLPPMPGMGAVSEVATTTRDDDGYSVAVDVHTRARWYLDVVVRRRGRPDATLTFGLEAP